MMSPTISECLEHARQCKWYAARTGDEGDRKFLLRKANDWTKLAREKELEIRASARAARRSSGRCMTSHNFSIAVSSAVNGLS
jgi:hypothetical protein